MAEGTHVCGQRDSLRLSNLYPLEPGCPLCKLGCSLSGLLCGPGETWGPREDLGSLGSWHLAAV